MLVQVAWMSRIKFMDRITRELCALLMLIAGLGGAGTTALARSPDTFRSGVIGLLRLPCCYCTYNFIIRAGSRRIGCAVYELTMT